MSKEIKLDDIFTGETINVWQDNRGRVFLNVYENEITMNMPKHIWEAMKMDFKKIK